MLFFRYLSVTMSIFHPEDFPKLLTDPTLKFASGDIKPFILGPPQMLPVAMRPPNPSSRQPSVPPVASISSAGPSAVSSIANGTPVAVPTQVKKLPQQPANSLAHLRISSNGGMRVPSGPNGAQHPASPHATPPSSASATGFAEAQGSPIKTEHDVKQGSPIGVAPQPEPSATVLASPSPAPSKPPTSAGVNVPNISNGYHISSVNNYGSMPKGGYMHANTRHNALNLQQMQQLMLPDSTNVNNIALRQQGPYVLPNGAYSLQMAATRPMQWSMGGQHPQNSRTDAIGVDSSTTPSGAGSPGRTPSANGIRTPQIARAAAMSNAASGLASPATHIARLTPHSPSPHMLSPNLAAAQVNVHSSPTRTPQPAIPTPSPSLQSRQLVGGSGAAGY